MSSLRIASPVIVMLLVLATVGMLTTTGQTTVAHVQNLKAVLLTSTNDYFSAPFALQEAENLMRNWGVPFDVISTYSVTRSTFWDSSNQVPKYQYIVLFGYSSASQEKVYPSSVRLAITGAVNNGTSILLVGAGPLSQLGGTFFGYTSYSDCPANPQAGGNCPTTAFRLVVNQTFAGPVSQDRTWKAGTVETGVQMNTAILQTSPRLPPAGVSQFMGVSTQGITYPFSVFTRYGNQRALVWWWGGVEGGYTAYRTGWMDVFTQSVGGGSGQTFQPAQDLFWYALNNITNPSTPKMMPWGAFGSMEVNRGADHVSLTSSTCNSYAIVNALRDGVAYQLNWNLNGISNGNVQGLSTSTPTGVTNPQGVAGFRYWGTIGGGATGTNNRFELVAVVDNKTATVNGGVITPISTSHFVTVDFADGNTTEIATIRVLVSTTGSPSWTVSLKDVAGTVIYTSPTQTASLGSPTWMSFAANAKAGLKGYVSRLQGNIQLGIIVASGTVSWFNQSSTQANYVLTGRSNYDVIYLDVAGNLNFANAYATMPDSIRMANGALFPTQNRTAYFPNIPGEVHPANIVGDSSAIGPTGVNFETFFSVSDWHSSRGQTLLDSCKSLRQKYGNLIFTINGWTHARTTGGSQDNDWFYGNGTQMGNSEVMKRYDDIVSYFNLLLGPNFGNPASIYRIPSWSSQWEYGTSAYSVTPALTVISAGGFWEAYQTADVQNGEVLGGFNRQSDVVSICAVVCSHYNGNLFSLPNRDGGKVYNMTWALGTNETRGSYAISETPPDWNYPTSDCVLSRNAGLAQPYDISSMAFNYTEYDAIKFWNTTLYSLTHTSQLQWNPATGQITWQTYTGTPKYINASAFRMPLVIRLPSSIRGSNFNSVSDTKRSGTIAKSSATYIYYQFNMGSGQDSIVASYGLSGQVTTASGSSSSIPVTSSATSTSASTSNTTTSSSTISITSSSNSTMLAISTTTSGSSTTTNIITTITLSSNSTTVIASTTSTVTTSITSTSAATSTATTLSTTSTATSITATTTSLTSSASTSSTSNGYGIVSVSWGYAPTAVKAGTYAQWQAQVITATGTSGSGLPITWYLDGRAVYSTATGSGCCGTSSGASYFGVSLSAGQHTIYFILGGVQSTTLVTISS